MDDGQVIPGLNEEWTFGGARLIEWMYGFVVFMIVQEVFGLKAASSMPILLGVWLTTTFGFAGLRKKYPDEDRGVRNNGMVALGFRPPGIPAPAAFQPYWSGMPVRNLHEQSEYKYLGIEEMLLDIKENPDELLYEE